MAKIIEWLTPSEKDIAVYYEYLLKRGLIRKPKPLENTIHLQCNHCNDTINSSYSGDCVFCTCGKIGIDQTEFYTRMIGNKEDYLVVKQEDNDNVKTL